MSAVEGVGSTQAPKPSWMFDRCMTDSLCRGMPLMIVVLNSDTPAQPGKVRLWSTAAEGQAALHCHFWSCFNVQAGEDVLLLSASVLSSGLSEARPLQSVAFLWCYGLGAPLQRPQHRLDDV